jgi:hypothetical protein
VPVAFAAQAALRDPMQLAVDERNQPIERSRIALPPRQQ